MRLGDDDVDLFVATTLCFFFHDFDCFASYMIYFLILLMSLIFTLKYYVFY